MSYTMVSRAEWGAKPPTKITRFPATPSGTVAHYVGCPTPLNIKTLEEACRRLRAIQQDAFRREYADIEYSVAIWDRYVFTLRGLEIQSGANGDQKQNRKRWSVVFLTCEHEPLSQRTIETFREFRAAQLPGDLVPHHQVAPHGTTCPGVEIDAQWATITAPPVPTPGTATQGVTNMVSLSFNGEQWIFWVTDSGRFLHRHIGPNNAVSSLHVLSETAIPGGQVTANWHTGYEGKIWHAYAAVRGSDSATHAFYFGGVHTATI